MRLKIFDRRWKISEILTAVLALVLVLVALWRFAVPKAQHDLVAVVTVDGVKQVEIPLYEVKDVTRLSLEEYGIPANLEMDHNRIRFVNVQCPDHLCEKSGWLVENHQSAVCMPNKTVVSVYKVNEVSDTGSVLTAMVVA